MENSHRHEWWARAFVDLSILSVGNLAAGTDCRQVGLDRLFCFSLMVLFAVCLSVQLNF